MRAARAARWTFFFSKAWRTREERAEHFASRGNQLSCFPMHVCGRILWRNSPRQAVCTILNMIRAELTASRGNLPRSLLVRAAGVSSTSLGVF